VEQSDLLIWAETDLSELARRELRELHRVLQEFISRHPRFRDSLVPYEVPAGSPAVVVAMAEAARSFGVGPMAGVAGAVADAVGRRLMPSSREVLVENGGDLFLATAVERKVGLFAGPSPLSGRLALRLPPFPQGVGLCTSSASVGPSLSLGRADAAVVLADSAVEADAAASLLGNLARREEDIPAALEELLSRPAVRGALLVMWERVGAAGDLELASLDG
jgi:ApbE superfamily uncharacterized protein (UPF0280 family)